MDCNRAEDEIDPTVIRSGPIASLSARARGGLGIVPGRTATHGSLWRQPIPRTELEERLAQAHRPYHRAIEEQLARCSTSSLRLLLDCHSMPPPDSGPSVIIGDRYGQSAAPWVTSEAVKIVTSVGFRAGVNQPFAGGHVCSATEHPRAESTRYRSRSTAALPAVQCHEADVGSRKSLVCSRNWRSARPVLLDRRFSEAAE